MRFTSIALAVVLLLLGAASLSAQTAITIENVTNLTDDSTIAGGMDPVITLRYNLTGAPGGSFFWPANGWEIYSPDGAEWGYVQAQTLPAFDAIGWPYLFVNHFNKTGGSGSWGLPQTSGGGNTSGVDTVGVMLAALFDEPGFGLPSGFNDLVLQIQFSSLRADDGLHICIDTSRAIPGAAWEWANPGSTEAVIPDWSDSRCFVVGCCAGMVGDVDGEGGDEPTVGDISRLIDFLFISRNPVDCLAEADVDQSGTLINPPLDANDVTVNDIAVLIDHLFISTDPLGSCP